MGATIVAFFPSHLMRVRFISAQEHHGAHDRISVYESELPCPPKTHTVNDSKTDATVFAPGKSCVYFSVARWSQFATSSAFSTGVS